MPFSEWSGFVIGALGSWWDEMFDHHLPLLGEISEHTMISYQTLPSRSLVMNRVGTRTAFQVSP